MIVLVVRYTGKPGLGDAIAEGLGRMAQRVRESEPGCLAYQVCRSQENGDNFLLYEVYESHAALAFHRETTHFLQIIEREVAPMLDGRERSFYSLVAGEDFFPGTR